jgi:hypothetical protein
MRQTKFLIPLLVLAVPLGGCGILRSGSATDDPSRSASTTPSGDSWIVVSSGSATPSPQPSLAGTRTPALPPVSFLPVDPNCPRDLTQTEVTIPLTIVPGAGRLTVTWPRQYDSDYRITAVKQLPLVTGTQPAYAWQPVPPGTGCTVTATITGLTGGAPYVVWLDAPNTGYQRDGTRHPYSGRSGVVFPQ